MVHSLCRAGTVSASLLNGNQQTNPASGSADDKGKPKGKITRQRRTEDKRKAKALEKMSVPKSAIATAISRNRHNTFACCHKKTML